MTDKHLKHKEEAIEKNPIRSIVDFEKDAIQHVILKLPHSRDESA